MKFNKTILIASLTTFAVSLPACDDKKAEKKPAVEAKKDGAHKADGKAADKKDAAHKEGEPKPAAAAH